MAAGAYGPTTVDREPAWNTASDIENVLLAPVDAPVALQIDDLITQLNSPPR